VVGKQEGPIVKWAGLRNGLVHMHILPEKRCWQCPFFQWELNFYGFKSQDEAIIPTVHLLAIKDLYRQSYMQHAQINILNHDHYFIARWIG